jgi:hypothetical protein
MVTLLSIEFIHNAISLSLSLFSPLLLLLHIECITLANVNIEETEKTFSKY